MTLDRPNYYSSQDRALYEKLLSKRRKGIQLTEKEKMFCSSMYHQEEFDAGLDGDR
jgi:hypothetical protein